MERNLKFDLQRMEKIKFVMNYFSIYTTCIFPWIRFPPCDIRYKYLMTNLRYTFSYKNKQIHKPFFVIENLLHYIFLSRRKCILPSNHICVWDSRTITYLWCWPVKSLDSNTGCIHKKMRSLNLFCLSSVEFSGFFYPSDFM